MTVQRTSDESNSGTSLRDQGVAAVEALASSTQDAVSFVASKSKEAVVSAAKETQRYVETAKDAALERGAEVAGKLQALADQDLRDTLPGRMIGTVAEKVTDAADTLRNQDLRALWDSTTEYARRNPAIFIAGVALAGFAIARFARATADRSGTAYVATSAPERTTVVRTKTKSASGAAKGAAKPRAPRKTAS